jgi:hypothetical protein
MDRVLQADLFAFYPPPTFCMPLLVQEIVEFALQTDMFILAVQLRQG